MPAPTAVPAPRASDVTYRLSEGILRQWPLCRLPVHATANRARLEQSDLDGKPNKPESRRNPEEFQLVVEQAKPCTQDERDIDHDAW
jgi:hypothetical protein